MLSQILKTKDRKPKNQTYSENYFKTVDLLLRDHPEKLDLSLIDGSKMTALDRIFTLPDQKKKSLIDLILKALTPNNTDAPPKKDLKKQMLSHVLWSSCKYSLSATDIINKIMDLKPALSTRYPYPIPSGTILHQIVFQSTELHNKKTSEYSIMVDHLIKKTDLILLDITLEILNQCNQDGKDVLAYADKTEHANLKIIEMLKNKKEKLEEEAKQNSTANKEESSFHQLDLAQSKESGQRKRTRASFDDDLDSDNGASSSIKQQKKDSDPDCLNVSFDLSSLKEHTWTQPSSPQKTIQAEHKDHVDDALEIGNNSDSHERGLIEFDLATTKLPETNSNDFPRLLDEKEDEREQPSVDKMETMPNHDNGFKDSGLNNFTALFSSSFTGQDLTQLSSLTQDYMDPMDVLPTSSMSVSATSDQTSHYYPEYTSRIGNHSDDYERGLIAPGLDTAPLPEMDLHDLSRLLGEKEDEPEQTPYDMRADIPTRDQGYNWFFDAL